MVARAPTVVSPGVRYTFRLWRIRDWHEEGYPEMRNVTYGWKLNDIGSCQGSLPLQAGLPPLRPGQHALIVERNGLPVWMGPVWSDPFDTNSAYAQFNGSEWASLLRRRRIRAYPNSPYWDPGQPGQDHQQGRPAGLNFRGVDQLDIARTLIQLTQEDHGGKGDLHLDPYAGRSYGGRTLSGVNRDRNYAATDRKEVWEALTQLGDVINGFDQRLRPFYLEGGVPVLWWEGFYPRQGESQQRHGIVFEYKEGWEGSNVLNYRWTVNASDMINVAEAANEETVMTAQDPAAWDFYPVLEGIAQKGGEGGVTSEDTLQQHADALLAENRRPRVTASLDLVPGMVELGPDLIGSEVRIRLTSWRHPAGPGGEPGLDRMMRIEEISVQAPSDERPEGATVTLGPILWEAWEPYG